MRYQDLSPYSYPRLPKPLSAVLNVGWLDSEVYERGDSTPEFSDKLAQIISRERVNQMRHIDPCAVCKIRNINVDHAGMKVFVGTAEVWVPSPSGDIIYAAPDLILHYILAHGYVPPIGFVESVLHFDLDSTWSGDKTRARLVRTLYDEMAT